MRGAASGSRDLFSYVRLEERVPKDHPLRAVRALADAALAMLDRRSSGRRITLGADKAYDVEAFVGALRERAVTPHIAVQGVVSKTGKVRKTAIDARTLRHAGYAVSQRVRKRVRKRIEEVFGWIKKPGGLAKAKLHGRPQRRDSVTTQSGRDRFTVFRTGRAKSRRNFPSLLRRRLGRLCRQREGARRLAARRSGFSSDS